MVRSHVLRSSLGLLFACSFVVHAQSATSNNSSGKPATVQYAPLFHALEQGKAPRMKVQVLNRSSQETTYAVIFGTGDEVLAGLTEFAEKEHIQSARITGIGAIENAALGWFNPKLRLYRLVPIDRQAEVLSLMGDIALLHGKPVVHAHMVAGFPDGSTHGGHLLEAHVRPTLEVIVTGYPNAMRKKLYPNTGLSLIDPSVKDDR